MGIFLGNLTVETMQSRLGIKLSEVDFEFLKTNRQPLAHGLKPNEWHCFDLPLFISCGSMDTAIKIKDILIEYNLKGQIQIGLDK